MRPTSGVLFQLGAGLRALSIPLQDLRTSGPHLITRMSVSGCFDRNWPSVSLLKITRDSGSAPGCTWEQMLVRMLY